MASQASSDASDEHDTASGPRNLEGDLEAEVTPSDAAESVPTPIKDGAFMSDEDPDPDVDDASEQDKDDLVVVDDMPFFLEALRDRVRDVAAAGGDIAAGDDDDADGDNDDDDAGSPSPSSDPWYDAEAQ